MSFQTFAGLKTTNNRENDKSIMFTHSSMKKLKKILRSVEWEALAWLSSLIFLAVINPYSHSHFTLCPYKNLGINFCPGCGLGKSIALFYHGDFILSFHTHPLGIIAFVIISFRIFQLIKRKYFDNKHKEVMYG